MPISFANIPQGWKVPLYWVEVDPSQAGLATIRQPALLVGIKTAEGIAPANVCIAIGTQAQADKQFGQGSQLSAMFRAFFSNNFAHEVWGLPLDEPAGSIASGKITVATSANQQAGTIHLYIAGQPVRISVGQGDTPAIIAESIETEIMKNPDLPVTAEASGADVTLTCIWAGSSGNEIDVRDSYYGRIGGEELPQGVTLTYENMGNLAGGGGFPAMRPPPPTAIAIPNLGEREFEYVGMPFTETESLNAWDQEYGFTDQGRWGWMRQLYGHVFSAQSGAFDPLLVAGATRNSGVLSIMAVEMDSPTPVWEWTAAYTAKAARALTNDPARPLQTLSLNKIKMAPLHQRFNRSELNILASSGFATQEAGSDGHPMIARETTTYRENLYSQGDDAYELVTTLATLAKLLRNQRHVVTTKFPRHKLANDGTRFGTGQAVVTPGIIKAELVANYRMDEFNGLVEDVDAFKDHLLVERDPNNPNRVNVLYPPDLINQLRIFAVLAQFRLQYDRGVDVEIEGTTRVAAGGGA